MKRAKLRGFTIVEVLVVIVVISILVLITGALYNNARLQARDAQLSDGADKIAEALQLWISKNGHFPAGGNGSSSALGTGTECSNGANGWVASTAYTCTVEDVLVASRYLPAGFVASLPQNTSYTGTLIKSVMVYSNTTTRKGMVFYSMVDPSVQDTAHYNTELTECGFTPATLVPRPDTEGMNNGICFIY